MVHDGCKKNDTRAARITRSHGTAFEPRLCVPKRRGAGSAPTTPYPPSLSPHHFAGYHRPPWRTILVLTRMVHPQTLRNYLRHPCSLSPLLSSPTLLLPTTPFFPLLTSELCPSLLLIRAIFSLLIPRPFIYSFSLPSLFSSLYRFPSKSAGSSTLLVSFLCLFHFLQPRLISPLSPRNSCICLRLSTRFSVIVRFSLCRSADPYSSVSLSLLVIRLPLLVQELVFLYTPLPLAVPLSGRGCV